jgi:electron transfer flavoprotein alpha subunit
MSVLVFLETENKRIRKISFEAISYASELSKGDYSIIGVVFGEMESAALQPAFTYGCDRVIHINNPDFNQAIINVYAQELSKLMLDENASLFITAQSALADPVAAKVSIQVNASIATNVCELPQAEDDEFVVKRSIYTGKAFENVILTSKRKVLSIKKNSVGLIEHPKDQHVVVSDREVEKDNVDAMVTGQEKSTGIVLLPEADIVVSGGRGLKGPENWEMIENLANELGAAKGCSKPVSDVGWRPHHEHVGQTGIKVSPNLYIAIGISGAIQHIAGVSASKVIVVINNDPEAPFFKNADYGIVGDAFDVVPKLIEVIRKNK